MNIAITFESASPSGAKVSIGITVDGGNKRIYVFEIDDLRRSVSAPEAEDFARMLMKAAISGLTRTQARNKLLPGLVVTI